MQRRVARPVWRGLGGNVRCNAQRAALPPYTSLELPCPSKSDSCLVRIPKCPINFTKLHQKWTFRNKCPDNRTAMSITNAIPLGRSRHLFNWRKYPLLAIQSRILFSILKPLETGINALPGRDGCFSRSRCSIQMDLDIQNSGVIIEEGFMSELYPRSANTERLSQTTERIKWCRICELVCWWY